MKTVKLQWEWKELISQLGGPKGVYDQILKRGVRPPPWETIKGWHARNSVPGRWAPLIVMIGQEEKDENGKPFISCVEDLWGGFGK